VVRFRLRFTLNTSFHFQIERVAMSIKFSCGECQKKMKAPDGTEGKKARCPACSAITRIPVAVAAAAAVPVAQIATPAPAPAMDSPPAASGNPFEAPTTTDFSDAIARTRGSDSYAPSWENQPSIGNFFKSTKEILFSPTETFRNLKREGTLGRALTFAVVGGVLMGALTGLTQGVLMMLGTGDVALGAGILVGAVIGGAIFYPIGAVLGCYLGGGILHAMLSLFGAKKYTYNATVRSIAYMQMASWPFLLIPILGPLIGGLWILGVQIIGLAEVHETTKMRVWSLIQTAGSNTGSRCRIAQSSCHRFRVRW